MFSIPLRPSPRSLFGPPLHPPSSPNRQCLAALGLPSTSLPAPFSLPEERVAAGADSAPLPALPYKSAWAKTPVSFPVFVSKKEAATAEEKPAAVLFARRILAFRQPCSVCGRPVDVLGPVVLLPCAHVAHPQCHEEINLNYKMCLPCENSLIRSPSGRFIGRKKSHWDHLLKMACCLSQE